MPERRVPRREPDRKPGESAKSAARGKEEDPLEAAIRSMGGIFVPLDGLRTEAELEEAISRALMLDAAEEILRAEES